jgi:thiol-disulfide isomerase/thioredoxin
VHSILIFNLLIKPKPKSLKKQEVAIYNVRNNIYDKNEYYNDYYKKGSEDFRKSRDDFKTKKITEIEYYKNSDIWDKIQNSKESKTPLGQTIDFKDDSLKKEIIKWKYSYISNNINFGSFILIDKDFNTNTSSNPLLIQNLITTVPLFAKAFPIHPYTTILQNKLNGITKLNIGTPYLDFLAKNLTDDNEIKLSSFINSKYTLIDFWGSWCGPCIAKTKTMMPLYQQYKNDGFNIVSIAREFKNLKAVRNRVKIENYEWVNLYDLDDKFQIWNKYGIGNGTGLMLLIDKEGKILAIDPSADKVEALIKAK